MLSLSNRIDALDWAALSAMLDERGYALTSELLSAQTCQQIADLYDRPEGFRSTVVMSRHGFGRGEYRYSPIRFRPLSLNCGQRFIHI